MLIKRAHVHHNTLSIGRYALVELYTHTVNWHTFLICCIHIMLYLTLENACVNVDKYWHTFQLYYSVSYKILATKSSPNYTYRICETFNTTAISNELASLTCEMIYLQLIHHASNLPFQFVVNSSVYHANYRWCLLLKYIIYVTFATSCFKRLFIGT